MLFIVFYFYSLIVFYFCSLIVFYFCSLIVLFIVFYFCSLIVLFIVFYFYSLIVLFIVFYFYSLIVLFVILFVRLISTDVLDRGMDLDVGVVVNYHLPKSKEIYVHRIGRTARAGREGLAISLVNADHVSFAINCYIYLIYITLIFNLICYICLSFAINCYLYSIYIYIYIYITLIFNLICYIYLSFGINCYIYIFNFT